VYAAFNIAFMLATRYETDPIQCGLISLASFLMMVAPITEANYLDATGLFTAILIGVITPEVYRFFKSRGALIKMPPGVPPAVTMAFRGLVPASFMFVLIWFVRWVMNWDVPTMIYTALSGVIWAGDTLPAAVLAEFMVTLFWIVGLHGDLIVGSVVGPLQTIYIAENIAAKEAGLPLPHIYVDPFRSFYSVPGGTGCTMALTLLYLRSKSKRLREIGRLELIPGIFNINEPIVFGTPIVLNPMLSIPYVISGVFNTFIAYILTMIGFAGRFYVLVPWTTPAPIGAFLSAGGDIGAGILSFLCEFVFPAIIYYPFFKMLEEQEVERERGKAEGEE